jgi:hypothetical protein
VPRLTNGTPDPGGRYVLLSMGMSNTTQEWCGSGAGPCGSWTFTGQAAADPAVNTATLTIANGAAGGQIASAWDQPTDPNYNRVRDQVLVPRGLSEAQVQVLWLKVANANPTHSLPDADCDADSLVMWMGGIVRAAKVRYPNLQIVFASSRTYGGHATTTLNPEPFAFESGVAVKRLIEAQIAQMSGAGQNPLAGDLNYDTVAPWIAWGAYLWANGSTPRADGLVWLPADVEAADGTHPSQSGEQKVGALLLGFFKTSPYAACWFLAGQSCP